MNSKKIVSIGLTAILLMSFATIFTSILPVFALPDPEVASIWVDPAYINGSAVLEANPAGDFYVRIKVNATDIMAAAYMLHWNNTLIGFANNDFATDHVITQPTGWMVAPPDIPTDIYTPDVVLGIDEHVFAGLGLTGQNLTNWTLCTYHFKVLYVPDVEMGEPAASCTLDLIDGVTKDTDLSPSGELDPPGDSYDTINILDGLYEIFPGPAAPYPEVWVSVNDTDGDNQFNPAYEANFYVDIVLSDMDKRYDMWGWEFTLLFNETHKDFINATEGPYLKQFPTGNESGTFFGFVTDPGSVTVFCLIYGDHDTPEDGGVLATIEFKEIKQVIFPAIETSELGLVDVLIADMDVWPPPAGIPVTGIVNGTNNVPQLIVGRKIDSFTDPYRKYGEKHFTQYIGLGPNMNADAYEPQDIVTIYALVEYGPNPQEMDPVQNKLVSFEVTPPNELEGFPMYRTAMTNASGIATLTFAIPWPCDNPERVLGKWKVYQSVEIVCQKVSDTEYFEVGWIIKLESVEVTNAKKCTNANVTFTYKNIAIGEFYDSAVPIYEQEACGLVFKGFEYIQIGEDPHDAKKVLFTAVIYDDLGVPIGSATIELWVDTGEYCHPASGSQTLTIHIPKWAYLGPNAMVYVNAYTDVPSECGLPYCPEKSLQFTISKQVI